MSERSARRAFGIESQADAAALRAEAARKQAFDEGVAHAQAEVDEARLQVEQQLAAQLARLSEALEEIAALRMQLIEESRSAVSELAVAAASRMLRARIEADDPVALRALEEARESLDLPDALVVRVHPDDQPLLSKHLDTGADGIELEADPAIERGGCVIESDRGSVDATVEAAVGSLQEALDVRDSPLIVELEEKIDDAGAEQP